MNQNDFPMSFRRVRQTPSIRQLFSTTDLSPRQLIYPLFIYENLEGVVKGIAGEEPLFMPSLAYQKKHSISSAKKEIEECLQKGISSYLLFIVPKHKTPPEDAQKGSFNFDYDAQVIRALKEAFGNSIVLFTDLCLCSNTPTGHCGLENHRGTIENESTVGVLVEKALLHAQAGSDVISPSDMMDNRILAIRQRLDQHGSHHTMIMSYSTKFSSQFYGPFREAAESTPSHGDRKSYQIDPRNLNDALRCSVRDALQGADILMVKPVGAYLDILTRLQSLHETQHHLLCGYQVSGEYQALYFMQEKGFLSFPLAMLESLYAIRRAGGHLIISYGAPFVKEWLEQYR